MGVIMSVAGAACMLGFIVLGIGLVKREDRPSVVRASLRRRITWRSPSVRILAMLLVGVVIALVTGWTVAIVAFPVAMWGLPYLVGSTKQGSNIDKLEAMEEWTRSLAGILTAGTGIEQALIATLKSAPAPIHDEVARLVARLRARWSTSAAIRAFADDLDDPTGDIIAANLLLGVSRRGTGLASILEGLAESVSMDIRSRRQVEADQAKPRTTARWVTIITVVVLCLLFLTGSYIGAYKQGVGQVILLVLLGLYGAVLVWMRKIAVGPKPMRLLVDSKSAQ